MKIEAESSTIREDKVVTHLVFSNNQHCSGVRLCLGILLLLTGLGKML